MHRIDTNFIGGGRALSQAGIEQALEALFGHSGTGSILSGNTSIAITHGLDYIPTAAEITITPTKNPTNTPGLIWVDTTTATQFTVNCEADPGASNFDFAWAARQVV